MDTKEVAERSGAARITVLKWAAANGLKRKEGRCGVLAYEFTEADYKRFLSRADKGYRRGRPKKDTSK